MLFNLFSARHCLQMLVQLFGATLYATRLLWQCARCRIDWLVLFHVFSRSANYVQHVGGERATVAAFIRTCSLIFFFCGPLYARKRDHCRVEWLVLFHVFFGWDVACNTFAVVVRPLSRLFAHNPFTFLDARLYATCCCGIATVVALIRICSLILVKSELKACLQWSRDCFHVNLNMRCLFFSGGTLL